MVSRARIREWQEHKKKQKRIDADNEKSAEKLRRFKEKQERDLMVVRNGRLEWLIPRDK